MAHDRFKAFVITLALLLPGTACGGGSQAITQRVETGGQIYQQNCASCHGLKGEGQPGWQISRPDGRLLAPPHDDTGHTWHHPDGLLFGIVKNGGASLNIPNFESGMPAFGEQLTDEEIRTVIDHIKTFWQPGQREGQSEISPNFPFPQSPPLSPGKRGGRDASRVRGGSGQNRHSGSSRNPGRQTGRWHMPV